MTKIKKKIQPPDYVFIGILGVILVVGLIMLSSASTAVAFQKFRDNFYYLKHQILFGFLPGIVLFWVASRIDYQKYKKFAFPAFLMSLLLLIAVFVPGVGFAYGGAKRWIHLGSQIFQPAEIVKLGFMIYLSSWLAKKAQKNEVNSFYHGFLPFLVVLGLILSLILKQPDVGTMSIVALISITIYWVAGGAFRHIVAFGLIGVLAFFVLIKVAPYRAARLTVFMNPQVDPQGIGYHINQALVAVGSGGFWGRGFGLSRQKHLYLPEVIGDSIFAIIAEEMGFVFCVALILLFLFLVYRGLRIARNAPDDFARLLAVGISAWIGFQVIINIGAMTGLLPLTGLPLPFISYGSSSLIALLFASGILANISRYSQGRRR